MAGGGWPKSRRGVKPGGHPLRREVVAHHQRRRVLAAAAEVFAEQGYRDTSVADIVKRAAIARSRFYDLFASKDACFVALYDEGAASARETVGRTCAEVEGDFPERVRVGIATLLSAIEADRALARAVIVEGPAAGPGTTEPFERMVGDFARLLRSGRDGAQADELPESVEETVVGGLYWLLYYALLEEQPRQIARLQPQLVEFALIPFIGAAAAELAAG